MSGRSSATPDQPVRVLYDGWPLVYAPGSPAAIHLVELLDSRPDGVTPVLALPGAGQLPPTLQHLEVVLDGPVEDTPVGHLRWEQQRIPSLARHVRAVLLHLTSPYPPIIGAVPSLLSPTAPLDSAAQLFSGHDLSQRQQQDSGSRLGLRLRESLGKGALAGVRALLWPADLPEPAVRIPLLRLPPVVHGAFFCAQPPSETLPDSYVLCPGPFDPVSLKSIAAVWSWVAAAGLDEDWALVMLDLSTRQTAYFEQVCRENGIAVQVSVSRCQTPEERASVFQRAGVVLNIGAELPWGDAALQALACARPLAGWETRAADARIGPGGYLVPQGDVRGLGAAVVTLLVEELLVEQLCQRAAERVERWRRESFRDQLAKTYQQIIKSGL